MSDELKAAIERVRKIADTPTYIGEPEPVYSYSDLCLLLSTAEAALAKREAVAEWQPMETVPKHGNFLLAVWEGDWNNPRKSVAYYCANGYPSGPSWSNKGNYRTEEGGAYELAAWMPLTPLAASQQAAKGEG